MIQNAAEARAISNKVRQQPRDVQPLLDYILNLIETAAQQGESELPNPLAGWTGVKPDMFELTAVADWLEYRHFTVAKEEHDGYTIKIKEILW